MPKKESIFRGLETFKKPISLTSRKHVSSKFLSHCGTPKMCLLFLAKSVGYRDQKITLLLSILEKPIFKILYFILVFVVIITFSFQNADLSVQKMFSMASSRSQPFRAQYWFCVKWYFLSFNYVFVFVLAVGPLLKLCDWHSNQNFWDLRTAGSNSAHWCPFIIRICNSRVANFVYPWWATISTCFLLNLDVWLGTYFPYFTFAHSREHLIGWKLV